MYRLISSSSRNRSKLKKNLYKDKRPVFFARRSYASAVFVIVILSVRLSHACFVTKPKNILRIYWYVQIKRLRCPWCPHRVAQKCNCLIFRIKQGVSRIRSKRRAISLPWFNYMFFSYASATVTLRSFAFDFS